MPNAKIHREGPSKWILTIDGPSGSGKTTVGRLLARALGMKYVDTGSLYRAVAWWISTHKVDTEDEKALLRACQEISLEIEWDSEGLMRVKCGGMDITERIRNEETGMMASKVSAVQVVRERLNQIQRELAKGGGMIFEGRDTGSVVFPDADLRFFLSATLDERARRRFKELSSKKKGLPLDEVKKKMALRDRQDSSRNIAPLRVPEGAICIDTTNMTPEMVVERILETVKRSMEEEELPN
jgi:cytidylate kinase